MTQCLQQKIFQIGALSLAIATASQAAAQQDTAPITDDTTVIYEAGFFSDYRPVNVNDMIDRIPGISLALNRGGGNRRGLGAGGNEILINGQRQTGKSNEGRSQLSRISADQVDYIEIIRGTSEELDVRGSGQVVNVVLLDSQSRSSLTAELNTDRYQDGTIGPGAKLSWTGQTGDLNYLLHVEAEPRYENRLGREFSHDGLGNLLETRQEESVRERTDYQTSFNLGYQFDKSMVQLNGLYGMDCAPQETDRVINGFGGDTVDTQQVREFTDRCRDNWEVGGDYEYSFNNGGKYRLLFIVNSNQYDSTRERFDVFSDREEKDLYIYSEGRDQERIVRTSYTWDLASNHGFEVGVERAQTIRDGDIRLGVAGSGTTSANHGDLIPVSVDNANSTVEEIRYENFLVHNWQLNDQMALESSLIYETSTISQSGDVNNERDFDFLRPKVDFRYDLTQTLQLRATVEKTVSQLSFSDFSTSQDGGDDDQNILAGNPEISQEQAWSYSFNMEYRLPNNIGVLNSQIYYRDITDIIDRIDVSTGPDNLASARGNIGDGERYGINLDASARLGFVGLPSVLLTVGFGAQDSNVVDPFLDTERRLRNNNRWFGRSSLRHDITDWDLSYGINYFNSDQDSSARRRIDINDIEQEKGEYGLSMFVEKKAFDGTTFRFDIQNANDPRWCRERTRFVGATVDGVVEEVENYCNNTGIKYALKVRKTF